MPVEDPSAAPHGPGTGNNRRGPRVHSCVERMGEEAQAMTWRDNAMDAGALAGRVLLAAIFLHEAWSKLTGYELALAYMTTYGVPGLLLPFAIAVEIGCGLLILVGYQTRVAALALAGFCVGAAVLFHNKFGDRNQLLHFEKDLAIAGGLLFLFAHGAGRWALDALLRPHTTGAGVPKPAVPN